jgi:hypothetical protein
MSIRWRGLFLILSVGDEHQLLSSDVQVPPVNRYDYANSFILNDLEQIKT